VGDAGGVDFRVEQTYDADPDDVARAYTEPALYELIGEVSSLGRPAVLDRRTEGDRVLLQVRYRFAGELSSAVRRALDPAKLTALTTGADPGRLCRPAAERAPGA
jgi:hypothetical protein